METIKTLASGIDIIGKRAICLLDGEASTRATIMDGWIPSLHRTSSSVTSPSYSVLIVESALALILLSSLGERRVTIKEEDEHYRVWQKAGIARSDAMARFAALLLYEQLIAPTTHREEA